MNPIPTFRHYAKFQREEVIVLGYNKSMNDVIIVRVTGLPVDDQMKLRMIASSPTAQSVDYLIPILEREAHASGYPWLRYLLTRMARNDKTVIRIPFKELTDMNPEQRAVFAGYGKPAQPEVEAPPIGSPEHNEIANQEATLVDYPEGMASAPAAPAQPDLAAAIASLAASQASMAESLEKLAAKVNKPARKAAPKKRVVRKKAASKTPVSDAVAEEAEENQRRLREQGYGQPAESVADLEGGASAGAIEV